MNDKERTLLGEFLKSRRARLSPEQFGLVGGTRRRTPGLRREEVAQLAGISVTWYTWIEQGREITVSSEILSSLGRVLQLTSQEQSYLFTLAGKQNSVVSEAPIEQVSPVMQQILDHQGHFPAYVMGRYWELLAWNKAATALFGDFSTLTELNMVWYTLVRPETRQLVLQWEERAQRLVAEFRADCSTYLTEPWLANFLERLKADCPEFQQWWSQHLIHQRDGGRRDFNHPQVGRLALEQSTFRLSHQPEVKMVLHVPLPEFESEAKLQRLLG